MTATVTRFFVLLIAILLLIFIGFSEAGRVYPGLQLMTICSQSDLYTNRINSMLELGFDINNRSFTRWAKDLQAQNPFIEHSEIRPYHPAPLGSRSGQPYKTLSCDQSGNWNFALDSWKYVMSSREKILYYDITSQLGPQSNPNTLNNSHSAGMLVLRVNQQIFYQSIVDAITYNCFIVCIVLGFAGLLMFLIHRKCLQHALRFNTILFHTSYAIAATAVLISLLGMFEVGIRDKTEALTKSLQERLAIPIRMQLNLHQHLSEIDRDLLSHYTSHDDDIQSIELIYQGKRLYHANNENTISLNSTSLNGTLLNGTLLNGTLLNGTLLNGTLLNGTLPNNPNSPYTDTPCHQHDYGFGSCSTIAENSEVVLKVIVPKKKVFQRLFRAAKNLMILFISTTLIANLFLNLSTALTSVKRTRKTNTSGKNDSQKQVSHVDTLHLYEQAEHLLRPVFTLGVFIEGLNLAFLPTFLAQIAPDRSVSLFFTLYFLCFAAVLAPAGRYAARHNLPNMMIFALVLNFLGLYGLINATSFQWALVARGLSACGQGILLIAIQAHLLRCDQQGKSSGGAQLIVIGFNIGMIAGASIGALLASLFGEPPVFMIGMSVCVFCIVFIYRTLTDVSPSLQASATTPQENSASIDNGLTPIKMLSRLRSSTRNMLNPELLKLSFLIGIPAKAAFTGILVFALPLVLATLHLTKDEVGQILIFYSFGIVLTTAFLKKIAQFIPSSALTLLVGCIGSGLGLILIGVTSSLPLDPTQMKILLVFGISTLGLFHGLIHAPAVTYITQIPNTRPNDRPALVANYRMLERVGHIFGPILATLFLLSNGKFIEHHIVLFGLAIILGGVIFLFTRQKHSLKTKPPSTATPPTTVTPPPTKHSVFIEKQSHG